MSEFKESDSNKTLPYVIIFCMIARFHIVRNIYVSFSGVCHVTDHKCCYNIVKVAVNPQTALPTYVEIYCQLQDRRIENWRHFDFYNNNMA